MPESNIQTNNPLESGPEPEPEPLTIDVAIHHGLGIDENRIQEIVKTILNDHNWLLGEISIAIVDDDTIHSLNREYLNHDYATDVLSFVLEQDPHSKKLEGEIIVSADTAQALAAQNGLDAVDELMLYVIHGTLHLAGFDDKEITARKKMRAAEESYTRRFDIKYFAPEEPDMDGDSI